MSDLLRERVSDGVIVRLVGKWLNASVLEGGVTRRPSSGTPQGGVISPLLANIYLHHVLDKWWVDEVLYSGDLVFASGNGGLDGVMDLIFDKKGGPTSDLLVVNQNFSPTSSGCNVPPGWG